MTSAHDFQPPAAGGPMANASAKKWRLLVVLYGAFALADVLAILALQPVAGARALV